MKSPGYFCHVVACSQNLAIGMKNKLPWHLPKDLKFFHDQTKGKALIMGRKTFESLGKPLPNRLNVVVTRRRDFQAEGVHICHDLDEAEAYCLQASCIEKYGPEICIIGGGEIYKQSLNLVSKIYLTRIYKDFEGDAFYPEVPQGEFKEISRQNEREGSISYAFLVYERQKNL